MKINQNKLLALLRNNWISFSLFTVISLIFYGNTISHGYTVDDYYVAGPRNEQIQGGFSSLPEIFTSSYYDMGKKNRFEYRPIVKASFAIENQFFGNNPNVSHFINILLYGLTCFLIFIFLRKIFKNTNIFFPFLVTLLFCIHPIHTEVVNSLKNRDETLSFIGILISLFYFVKYSEKNKITDLIIALFAFAFAFFSKGSALAFIVVIPLTLYFFSDMPKWKYLMIFFLLAFIFIGYKLLPRLFLDPPFREKFFYENPLMFEENIWIRFGTAFYVLLFYIKMLFLPHPMTYYYGFDTIPISNFSNFWSFISVFIHIGIFLYALKKLKEKHPVSYGIFFYLIVISMYSNILKPPTGIVADRFMYEPSLGFIIVFAFLVFKAFKINIDSQTNIKIPRVFSIAIAVLFLISCAVTIDRNSDWESNYTLYKRDSKTSPKSFVANRSYANELFFRASKGDPHNNVNDDIDTAIVYYNKAIGIYPDQIIPWQNLGKIYMKRKQYEKAIYHFKRAIDIMPDAQSYKYLNIGLCYSKLNRPLEAIPYFEKGLEIYPETNSFLSMAKVQADIGNFEAAIRYSYDALKLTPNHTYSLYNLGVNYLQLSKVDSALLYFSKTVQTDPFNHEAHFHLSSIYETLHDTTKSNFHKQKYNEIIDRINQTPN